MLAQRKNRTGKTLQIGKHFGFKVCFLMNVNDKQTISLFVYLVLELKKIDSFTPHTKGKETTLERADFNPSAVDVCNCRKVEIIVYNFLSLQFLSAAVPAVLCKGRLSASIT